MAVQLAVPGRAVDAQRVPYEGVSSVSVLYTVDASGVARGAAPEQVVSLPPDVRKEDVVVELDLGDGVRQWSALTQLQDDGVAVPETARGGTATVLRISPVIRHGQRTRGIGNWILKGLKILHIDPVKNAADDIVERIDGRITPGLKALDVDGNFRDLPALDATDPYLLFVHGTMSSTHGGFGELFVHKIPEGETKPQNAEYQALFDHYKKRVLAFEHATLGVSPIANALELAEALPDNATLHIVSHSRGGLVAELLCLTPDFNDAALQPFGDTGREEHEKQREALLRLRGILQQKKFKIEKFVRVACPARGTTLASQRLDLFASVILNVLSIVPEAFTGPFGAAAIDTLKEGLLELIKQRTDPAELPGLEAQMPTSPLVRFLQGSDATAADLAAISGDVEASGFWGRLKVLATDAFYQHDHDLVVDTTSMYGGIERTNGAYYFFDKGIAVNHFSYFKNKRTRARLSEWLTAGTGFEPYRTGVEVTLPPSRGAEAAARPILFVVPAEFGSTLVREDRTVVWPNVRALLRTDASATTGAAGAEKRLPRGVDALLDRALKAQVLTRPYQPLFDFFTSRYDVYPFAWDWRQSIADAATALAAEVERAAATGRRIRFLGHGLGGLVIRTMAISKPDLWSKMVQNGTRALMLGTAQRGTHWAVALIAGANRLARLLAMLGAPSDPREVGKRFAQQPGILDLLPTDVSWPSLGVAPGAELLAAAKQRRDALSDVSATELLAVVGEADATPAGVRGTPTGLEIGTTAYGDGRVTWESAALAQPPWHVRASFGNLIADRGAFGAYVELLETGSTSLLPQPRDVHAPRDLVWSAPDDAPLLFPANDDLADAAIGPRVTAAATRPLITLRVSIKNGNVNTAEHPVIVGHYIGDPIVSAEKMLDRLLDKALSRRFHLRIYPGADGTNAVIFGPKQKKPEGAIVIGLGEVGKLNAEKLRRAVTDAAIRYSMAIVERDGENAPASVSVSSVLLGSNGGSALSIESSIHAIVRGILDANRAFILRDHGMRIDAIELIEFVESRAVVAAHALHNLNARLGPELADNETLEPQCELQTTDYIRYDAPISDYAGGWPRRVRIVSEPVCKEGEPLLRFTVLTDRARAETTLQCTSERLVRSLVDAAATNTAFDAKTANALYELLIPNDIKDAADEETSVVLIVDDVAAQYPWELCVDRLRPSGGLAIEAAGVAGAKPLSIDMGLIRQFETPEFRMHPRTPRANIAFVVGDTESGLERLDGAEREAHNVEILLSARAYTVNALYRPKSFDLVRELFASDYRILHIAAHGNFDEKQPKHSGIVVGKDTYLTACEIRQMRVVPELVFLNCCHLGKLGGGAERQFHRVAASIARELIEMGVGAVVAAGWAVDDTAGVTFATTFYDELITQGGSFSSAVKAARNQTWKKHPDTNTWGAYQCYGNPDFRLVIDGDGSSGTTSFCSRHEYLSRFKGARYESNAAGLDDQQQAEVARELKRLHAAMKPDWADGEVETAYALAIGELGDYKTAIDALEKTLKAETATMPINGVEQLANFLARYAVELYEQAGYTTQIDALLDRSLELLNWLSQSGETAERLSLFGATWKRRAFVAQRVEERLEALKKATGYYGRAQEMKRSPYAGLNWAVLQGLADPNRASELLGRLDEWEAEIRRTGDQAVDLWSALAIPDASFTRLIVSGAGADAIRQVAPGYRAAAIRFGTAVKLRSVREHLQLIARILRDQGKDAEARAVEEIITALG